jgi:transposase-like protein
MAIVVVITVLVVVVVFGPLSQPRHCPKCEAPMPRFRIPTSFRQMFLGGWTCPNCGCEIDRSGKEISK